MPVTVPVQQNSAYPQQQTQQNSNVGQTLMPPQTHPPGSLSPVRPSSTGKSNLMLVCIKLNRNSTCKTSRHIEMAHRWNCILGGMMDLSTSANGYQQASSPGYQQASSPSPQVPVGSPSPGMQVTSPGLPV